MLKRQAPIPSQYQDEFNSLTAQLIRKRVRLLSLLIFILFWVTVGLGFLSATYQTFNLWEIPFDIAILTASLFGFFAAGRIEPTKSLKPLAYLINTVLLISHCFYYLIYPEGFYVGCLFFVVLIFFIVMAMPWRLWEVAVINGAAVILFYLAAYIAKTPFLQKFYYFETNMTAFLCTGIICVVFKYFDERRRREQFLLRKDVDEKNQIMERELELAKRVHRSLIPKSFANEKVDIAVTYLPVFYVGGDYAKFEFLDQDRLLIFIMDITGHGVSAALLVNRLHAEVMSLTKTMNHPGELLRELDLFVHKAFEGTHKFLTACACLLDFKHQKLLYSNFGHPPQILYQSKTQDIQWLKPQRHMIGVQASKTDGMHETDVTFETGDRILLFTDGVLEVKGKGNEFYGEKRLERFIKESNNLKSERFNQRLIENLEGFKSSPFADDIFLLNIQIKR